MQHQLAMRLVAETLLPARAGASHLTVTHLAHITCAYLITIVRKFSVARALLLVTTTLAICVCQTMTVR